MFQGLSPSQPYSRPPLHCPSLSPLFLNEAIILTPSGHPTACSSLLSCLDLHSCTPGSVPCQSLQKLPSQMFKDGSRLAGCCSCLPGPPPLPSWAPWAWPLWGFRSSWGPRAWHPLYRLDLEAHFRFWFFIRDNISSRRGRSPSASDPAARGPQALAQPKNSCKPWPTSPAQLWPGVSRGVFSSPVPRNPA